MIICICAFTEKGRILADRIRQEFSEDLFVMRDKEISLQDWVKDCFEKRLPIIFVGACGIAVRSVAHFIKDKLYDSPVLVMDEAGQFVIPILSGHVGGANVLAERIAKKLSAQAVITTATDVNGKFSVDVFASENGFHIVNRDGIAKISSKILREEKVTVYIDPAISVEEKEVPKELCLVAQMPAELEILAEKTYLEKMKQGVMQDHNDGKENKELLTLVSKEYVLGVGCKKGKAYEELKDFLEVNCPIALEQQLCMITSIDLKKKEMGLVGLAQFYHVPFRTYSADELMGLQGDFSSSDFVKQTTGVDCVSERAAVMGAGGDFENMCYRKLAYDGMTLAVAKRKPAIYKWK